MGAFPARELACVSCARAICRQLECCLASGATRRSPRLVFAGRARAKAAERPRQHGFVARATQWRTRRCTKSETAGDTQIGKAPKQPRSPPESRSSRVRSRSDRWQKQRGKTPSLAATRGHTSALGHLGCHKKKVMAHHASVGAHDAPPTSRIRDVRYCVAAAVDAP